MSRSNYALWLCTFFLIFAFKSAPWSSLSFADNLDSREGKDTTSIPGAVAQAEQNPDLAISGFDLTSNNDGLIRVIPSQGNIYVRSTSNSTLVLAVKAYLEIQNEMYSSYTNTSYRNPFISRADAYDATIVGQAICNNLHYHWDTSFGSRVTVADIDTGVRGEIYLNYGFGFKGSPANSYLERIREQGKTIVSNGVQKISALDRFVLPRFDGPIVENRGNEIWLPVRKIICVR